MKLDDELTAILENYPVDEAIAKIKALVEPKLHVALVIEAKDAVVYLNGEQLIRTPHNKEHTVVLGEIRSIFE